MDFSELLKDEAALYTDNEWNGKLGGKDVTIYARPLTPVDIKVISRKDPTFIQTPTFGGMITAIIRKAHDGEGKPIFAEKDRGLLQNIKATLIAEIFGDLFGDQFDDDTDFEGNSIKTASD